ncbi:tetratricopeptide repeat protein [Saccharospirillum mangrovi]|uniref:tetratricopeptide repeat protein n=1 Tax=Saccharospirillum mangrovi TaxID=2161747 RepID=UPI000D37FB48|nr:tetratricopeptide repeat protein [Saccharospirillum mangrovi]
MLSHVRPLLLLPLVAWLSACATLSMPFSDLDTQVATWSTEHRYDKALSALRAVPEDDAAFEAVQPRIRQLESERKQYIADRLQSAASQADQANFPAALTILDDALERLPDTPELQTQRDDYEQQRQRSIQRHRRFIQLAHARYLLAIRPSEEALLQASPSNLFAQQRYRSYQQDLNQASADLYAIGRQALYENDSDTAVEALSLSNQLAPNELSNDLLANVRQAERSERQRQRDQQAAAAQTQWPQLEQQFEASLRLNDLQSARRLLSEMQEIKPDASAPLRQRLERRIDAEATALLERGRLLYGQGLLQEALAVWREALQLKPDDPDILAAIERTETFLQNLENWGE